MPLQETRHPGWGIVTNDQRPAMPQVGSGRDVAIGFLTGIDGDLARAYKLTSARVPEMGHFAVDIAEWLIQSGTPSSEPQDLSHHFAEQGCRFIQQDAVLTVPFPMEQDYMFNLISYQRKEGIRGYFIFGNQIINTDDGRHFEGNTVMVNRVEMGRDGRWRDCSVNGDSYPEPEFSWIARKWGKDITQYRVVVKPGGTFYSPDGQPEPVPQAA